MNSTKLFNFKFFIENLKKSKAIIALLCIVLPMFTILQIVNSEETFYEYISLSGFNIFFMYIIPIILSITLFSYLYKKSSVDFMLSKPISRKTMFFTNLIGGGILLILIQLVNLALQFVLLHSSGVTFFPVMLFDIFLYQTVGYLFVYVVSTLAMSMSGNKMTQIAVTMLIIFFIPIAWILIVDTARTSINAFDYIYTAPLQLIKEYKFEYASIIKMLVLIVAYTIIGYVMFKKKKFEAAGESFLSENTHLIVKAFTLLPFTLPFIEQMSDFEENCFILAIALIYWFVYDLITSKKIKLLKNIIYFIFSFIAIIVIVFVCSVVVEKIFPYVYEENESYVSEEEQLLKKFDYKASNGAKLFISSNVASDAQKDEIMSELRKLKCGSISQISYYYDVENNTIKKIFAYDYKDHTIVRFEWNISTNYDLMNKLAKIYNEAFERNLSKIKKDSEIKVFVEDNNIKSSYYYDYIYNQDVLTNIYKFIEENKNDEVDTKKEYIVLQLTNDSEMKFISNKVEEIKSIIGTYKENSKYNYDEIMDDAIFEDAAQELDIVY